MLIVSTLGPASGHAGGAIATRDRTGAHLRARGSRTQPRTIIQQLNRNTISVIGGLWRALTAAQRQSWESLAEISPRKNKLGQTIRLSGYALFASVTAKAINASRHQPTPTGGVVIEIEGVPIATLAGQTIQINDVTIAEPPPV